jgi:predicted amidohydrolase YtcJ
MTRLMKTLVAASITIGFTNVLEAETPKQIVPDTILVNGKIVTVDDQFTIAQAVAIKGERILAVGANEAIRALANNETKVLNLKGLTVIPGLIDDHLHFIRGSEHWANEARFDGLTRRNEALSKVQEAARNVGRGEWVFTLGGWTHEQFRDEPRGFERKELDSLVPDKPVFIQEEYARAFVNSAYFKAVGIPIRADKNYQPDEFAKHVVRDKNGVATGLIEGGFQMIGMAIARFPKVTEEQQEAGIRAMMKSLNAYGLTAAFDPGGMGIQEASYQRWAKLHERGELTLRTFYTFNPSSSFAEANIVEGTVKAIESREKMPFQGDESFNRLALGESYMGAFHFDGLDHVPNPDANVKQGAKKILTAAAKHGWQVQSHALMPQTINNIFDIMDEVNKTWPVRQLRWSITHADNIGTSELERARRLGVNLQLRSTPLIDNFGGEKTVQEYGEGLYHIPPLRMVQDSGVTFGLGTDGTKANQINPFVTLYWATTGKRLQGDVITKQTLTREEALIAATRSNALLMFQEQQIGAIKPGLLADMLVLEKDYMTIPLEEILTLKPAATIHGGKIVHGAF